MPQDIELISLSELIAKVKNDLMSQVQLQGSDSPLLFVDEIGITAQVVAKRETGEGEKAGLSLSVLGFGVNAGIDSKINVAHELTQSITVKLSPLFSKTEYVQQLSEEERSKAMKNVKQGAVRGEDGGTHDMA